MEKFGRIEDVAKLFFGIAVLLGIVNTQLLRKSNLDAAIAIAFSLFGAFAFGVYPLGKCKKWNSLNFQYLSPGVY